MGLMTRLTRRSLFVAGVCLVFGAGLTAPIWGEEASDLLRYRAEGGVVGLATYYAKRYNGRATSSGERYRPDRLTAAHPDLPLGTRVKVINIQNGREVVVKINDRCRKRKVPIIDLSRAAAKELRLLVVGVGKVRIIALPGEKPDDFSEEFPG